MLFPESFNRFGNSLSYDFYFPAILAFITGKVYKQSINYTIEADI